MQLLVLLPTAPQQLGLRGRAAAGAFGALGAVARKDFYGEVGGFFGVGWFGGFYVGLVVVRFGRFWFGRKKVLSVLVV